jgi:hypothetical protein
LHREADILQGGQLRKQIGQLKGAPKPPPRPDGWRKLRDVLPVNEHLSGRCAKLTGHEVEIGRLAGPVRSDNRRERAGREPARDVVDGHVTAEANGQPARFQRGRYR